ncbi:MAG: DUF4901 domain-containing protein [Clostridiales Family XIII bacterium]|jgi:hypothetical protein|nr:DUF4901 domain-containing protein [Clostridiales Family XIII bacterium]
MKKIISILLCAALAISAAVPAFAADNNSKELEAAILKAKSLVNIPDGLTEFTYDVREDEGSKAQLTFWLSWHDREYRNSVDVSIRGGYMTSYYANNYMDAEYQGLGTMTREAAAEIAAKFLSANNPALAAKMVLTDQSQSDTSGHNLVYMMYENGTPATMVKANIRISSHTGEVTNYNWDSVDFGEALPSTAGVISEAIAKGSYISSGGLTIEYRSWYDYENRQLNVFPAYSIKGQHYAIDARTGKPVQLSDGGVYPMARMAGAGEAAADSVGAEKSLSPAEMDAVSGMESLLTSSQAQARAATVFPALQKMKPTSSQLTTKYDDDKAFIWSIEYEDSDGTYAHTNVDAKSGEVIAWSYYRGTEDRKGKTPISGERGLSIATGMLEKAAPGKFSQTALNEDSSSRKFIPMAGGAEPYAHSYSFDRKVGGYTFVTDSIYVTVDPYTEEITSYRCNWHNNAKFPEIKNPVSPESAFEMFDEYGDFRLAYSGVAGGQEASSTAAVAARVLLPVPGISTAKPTPVYLWMNSVPFHIDPLTGAKIDYRGREYQENKAIPYTDIEGHWAKDTINRLFENGYYVTGGLFEPNGKVTQSGFFSLLTSAQNRFSDQDALYKHLILNGVLLESEKAPEAALTRYDAAKFAVRYLNYQDLAAFPEIFVNPYADEISDGYKGYVAIAKAISVMKGDTAGNFGGDREMTNAESAVVVFNVANVRAVLAARTQASNEAKEAAVRPPGSASISSASGGGGGAVTLPGIIDRSSIGNGVAGSAGSAVPNVADPSGPVPVAAPAAAAAN